MKVFVSLLAVVVGIGISRGGISDFQCKSRLLIVTDGDQAIVKNLKTQKAGLDERDLKVFILSGLGGNDFPTDPKLAEEFKSQLSPPVGKPMVYFIGKDGRTTLEWPLADFTFEKLYASIDAMPMRKREMREEK